MTDTKFTPGPLQFIMGDIWDSLPNGEPGVPLFRSAYAERRSWGRQLTQPELQATGTLFAASPALYEALADFMENPAFQVAVGGNPGAVDAMMARASAALALARGDA